MLYITADYAIAYKEIKQLNDTFTTVSSKLQLEQASLSSDCVYLCVESVCIVCEHVSVCTRLSCWLYITILSFFHRSIMILFTNVHSKFKWVYWLFYAP